MGAEPDEIDRDETIPHAVLGEAERLVSDAIGRLMVLWGFKRNMGRVWTVLFLSEAPLTARELQEALRLSSGAVSMTLGELSRWGVVQKHWVPGDRRDFYIAESDLWKMISRVLRERERGEVSAVIEAFERALTEVDRSPGHGPDAARRRSFQRERIKRLLELSRLGRSMIDALIANARADASWLPSFRLLGRR